MDKNKVEIEYRNYKHDIQESIEHKDEIITQLEDRMRELKK